MKAKRFVSIICTLIILIGCCSVLLACQPKHTCQNVCQDCGKCLNADCTEEACVDKCLGHHVCESACSKCGKCTDIFCKEAVCVDKCQGHHDCRFPCSICGKCIHQWVNDPEYSDKCQGHDSCQNPCPKCGGCTGQKCNCPKENISCNCGYPWFYTHLCANVCVICGYCTNSECDQEPCTLAQCPGHDVPMEIELANEPITEYVYTEPTAEEKRILLQAFCDAINRRDNDDWAFVDYAQLISYYGKVGDAYFYTPRYTGNSGSFIRYYIEDIYLISYTGFDTIYVYTNGVSKEVDDAYKEGLITYEQVVVFSHYLMAYGYRAACIDNNTEFSESIKVNVVARLSSSDTLFFIGEKPTLSSVKTPRMVKAINLDYSKTTQQCGIVECELRVFGNGNFGNIQYAEGENYYFDMYDVWLMNEYFNLYLETLE